MARRTTLKRAPVYALIALFLVFGVFAVVLQSRSGEAAVPQIMVTAPRQVAAGQPIEVTISVRNANGVAGYEATVGYDVNRLHVLSLNQQPEDLSIEGLAVQPVGPVEVPEGIVIGAYSCPAEACAGRSGAPNTDDSGDLRLATVTLVADDAGMVEITLSQIVVVDAHGQKIDVQAPTSPIQIQIEGA